MIIESQRCVILLAVIGLLSAIASNTGAALLAYDDFAVPPANPTTWEGPNSAKVVKTGSGWNEGWDAQSGNKSTYYIGNSKPLTFSKNGVTLAGSANYLEGGGAYTSIGRAFHNGNYFGDDGIWGSARRVIRNAQGADDHVACGADGSTVWFSALVRNDAPNNKDWRLSLHDNHIAWNDGKPCIAIGVSANGRWCLDNNGTIAASDVPCVTGKTYFMAMKIEFAAGADTATLYINPTPGQSAPDVPGFAAKASDVYFQCLRFLPGNDKDCGAIAAVRIGQSYADVAPVAGTNTAVPVPAAAANPSKLVLETTAGAQATQSADGDATRIDIQKAAADIRCVQVYMTRPELLAGKYTLTFMAKADRPRSIGILAAQERSPSYRPLTGSGNAQVGTDWKRYILQFQIARPTSDPRTPVIQFGDTTGTIWIKNCTVEPDTTR